MAVSEKYYLQVAAELFERVTGAAVSRRTDSQSMVGVEAGGIHDSAENNSKPRTTTRCEIMQGFTKRGRRDSNPQPPDRQS
jgi:hypothetical protein